MREQGKRRVRLSEHRAQLPFMPEQNARLRAMVRPIVANQIGGNPLTLPAAGQCAPPTVHILIKSAQVKREQGMPIMRAIVRVRTRRALLT